MYSDTSVPRGGFLIHLNDILGKILLCNKKKKMFVYLLIALAPLEKTSVDVNVLQ